MVFRFGFQREGLEDFYRFYNYEKRKVNLGPFLGPKEMNQRMMPGHQRKQDLKDLSRRKDYEKVKSIISKIFHKKKVTLPPNSAKDLGWQRVPK